MAKDTWETERGRQRHGTVRQELLEEPEDTRNLFEATIFKSYPCEELDRLSGACARQIECTYSWWREQGY
jgi:hypothetical protein